MGIRFACHVCGKQLNIKRQLAGRRGVCPACSARFRIPHQDAETSLPVETKTAGPVPGSSAKKASPQAKPSQQVVHGTETGNRFDSSAESEIDEDDSGAVVGPEVGQQAEVATNRSAAGYDSSEAMEFQPGFSEREVSSIAVLDDEPDACWYVRPPSGGQYGPATADILKQWIQEGRVAATALLWREGWPQWRDAGEALPELAAQLPTGSVDSESQSLGTAPQDSPGMSSSGLAGEPTLGTARRARLLKRIVVVGILVAVAATLVGILVVVIGRGGQ